jgi:hypothetical protein
MLPLLPFEKTVGANKHSPDIDCGRMFIRPYKENAKPVKFVTFL